LSFPEELMATGVFPKPWKLRKQIPPCRFICLEVGFAVVQVKTEGKFPSVIFFRFQCGDALLCFHTLIGSGANLSVNFSLRLRIVAAARDRIAWRGLNAGSHRLRLGNPQRQ
jgi:hypothetical protein